MKKIFTHADAVFLGLVKSTLEQQGVECLQKPEHLHGGLGEIPFTEVWPELWIVEDRDEALAGRIIKQLITMSDNKLPWRCPACGESNEPAFDMCWSCGNDRP